MISHLNDHSPSYIAGNQICSKDSYRDLCKKIVTETYVKNTEFHGVNIEIFPNLMAKLSTASLP